MKKQFHKRLRAMLVCLCAACALLGIPAQAADIDTGRGSSLTLRYTHEGTAIAGAWFDLYRAADVDPSGTFTLCGDFSAYPVRVNGLSGVEQRALAETLKGYALRDALTPLASGATDASGSLRFPDASSTLPTGLYLVVGRPFSDAQYIYTAEPFLVSLPSPDVSGIWRYEVNASPKHTRDDLATDGGTVVRRVLKHWDDSGDAAQRPGQLTMYLFGSGRLYDTVALSAANSWRWHWDSLPEYDENGLPIDWLVVEEPVPGYTVSVTCEGVTFVVTNTPSSAPDSPDAPEPLLPDTPPTPDAPDGGGAQDGGSPSRLPQTGLLWWPVPVLTLLGLLCLFLGALSRRRERGDA